MQNEQPRLELNDFLGRSVSSRSKARYAHNNNKLHPDSLLPSKGSHQISVDKLIRCSVTDRCKYTKEHVRIAQTRGPTGTEVFYGWDYFTVLSAKNTRGCEVIPDSICCNKNHVLIRFPPDFKGDKEKLKVVAKLLALHTRWLEVKDPTIPTPS